ncbi:MAG: SPOR domain-containing protein [Christensenellales bacterium]|jgi:hypothetical protein
MATRRRSRRRSRRGISPQTLRVIVVVAIVGAFAYIALATTVGTFLAEKLIAPIFRALSGEENPANTPPAQEVTHTNPPENNGNALPLVPPGGYSSTSAAPASSDRTAGEIRLESRTYYTLQMGAFSNKQNAEKLAAELQGRAAAGYVYFDDGLYRVIAAAYESQEDARAVKEQLMEQNGLDSKVNELVLPTVALRVTAEEAQFNAVRDAFDAAERACSELFEISEGFDKKELTAAQVATKLQDLADSCEAPARALEGEAGQLTALLLGMTQDLRDCSAKNGENTVEFSALLKYTQIKVVCAFADFLKQMKETG